MNLKLGAVEVLFMHYITDRTTEEVHKYDFWQFQYDRQPADLVRRLLDAGVIYEDDSLPETLQKLRAFELKYILKDSGFKVTGNKPELIKRILQYAAEIDFTDVPLKNVYKLSEACSNFYSQTRFLNYFHFNGSFDVHEVYEFYLDNQNLANHQIAIGYLEEKVHDHINDENKYTAVKCYYLLANYARDEMGDLPLSIYYLNHFTMLVVLQAAHHYDMDSVRAYFDLDGYTKDRYRAFMKSEEMRTDELCRLMMDSTKALPYSPEELEAAAAFIMELIDEKA